MRHSRWRKRLRDWKKALRDCYCVCGTAAGGNGFAIGKKLCVIAIAYAAQPLAETASRFGKTMEIFG